jgi:hypothetical protein
LEDGLDGGFVEGVSGLLGGVVEFLKMKLGVLEEVVHGLGLGVLGEVLFHTARDLVLIR